MYESSAPAGWLDSTPAAGWFGTGAGSAYAAVNPANTYGAGAGWSSFGAGLLGLADTYVRADAAVKVQQNAAGVRYLEGEAGRVPAAAPLVISPGLLLLLGVGAVVMLSK